MPRKEGKAATISDTHFRVVLKMCDDSRYPARDRALLYASHKQGFRAKEMAGLVLADLLDGAGRLVDVIRLRRAVTKRSKHRESFLANVEARKALQAYLDERLAAGAARSAPVFVSRSGKGFSANGLQKHFAAMYERAGVKGSSHSGRRTFASKLHDRGANIKDIQQLLGVTDVRTAAIYIDTDESRLARLAGLI